jgi:hypothetical protein
MSKETSWLFQPSAEGDPTFIVTARNIAHATRIVANEMRASVGVIRLVYRRVPMSSVRLINVGVLNTEN